MGRALIIGCGGVASVAIHKCCQNSEVFTDIMIASRIGIDVKKEFRGLGIGSECVKALTYEIMAHGAIPYYGTWSGNIASQNVARTTAYRPAWTEMFAQNID